MITVQIEATRRAIREQYFPIGPAHDIFVNLTLLPDYDAIKVGGPIELVFLVYDETKERKKEAEGSEEKFSLRGVVSWKRPREIKLPGKVMPAGIGIKLDQKSYDLVEERIIKEQSELSDLSLLMVGGNYIRVRHDIAEILRKKESTAGSTKQKKAAEKRSQPRLALSVPVEVFINDQVSNLKMRDISLGGMSLETTEPLKIGEDIVIILEDRSVRKQFILKARVVRHIPHPNDSRKIVGVGVVFLFEGEAQQKELMKFIVRHS